ncbi:MAG: hypothetical protein AAF244_02495, partial [Pseudomonadota bacterium]
NFKLVFVIVMSCFVSSCTLMDHSGVKPTPSLMFDHLQPYSANGRTVMVTQSFTPDKMTLAVTKEFGESPAHLVSRYAQSRFVTNSVITNSGMIFNIKEASLTKQTRETDPLLFMTGSTLDKYKMKVFLELFPVLADGKKADPFTLYYEQELKLSENVSLADREYAQFEFYEKMINDIDQAVSNIMLKEF